MKFVEKATVSERTCENGLPSSIQMKAPWLCRYVQVDNNRIYVLYGNNQRHSNLDKQHAENIRIRIKKKKYQ